MGIHLVSFWKRKETTVESAVTWGRVERNKIKAQSLWALKRNLDSILVTMGSHQTTGGTRKKIFWLSFQNNLHGCFAADTLQGARLETGRWGRRLLVLSRWEMVGLDRAAATEKLRIVSKLRLKFKSSPNLPNSKIDLASACLSKTFTRLETKLNCEKISQNICLE